MLIHIACTPTQEIRNLIGRVLGDYHLVESESLLTKEDYEDIGKTIYLYQFSYKNNVYEFLSVKVNKILAEHKKVVVLGRVTSPFFEEFEFKRVVPEAKCIYFTHPESEEVNMYYETINKTLKESIDKITKGEDVILSSNDVLILNKQSRDYYSTHKYFSVGTHMALEAILLIYKISLESLEGKI